MGTGGVAVGEKELSERICEYNERIQKLADQSYPQVAQLTQMAAPADTRTPNMHRAKTIAPRECGWKQGDSGDRAKRKS